MNKKMADVDTDSFEECELRPEEPTDEHIPLNPGIGGVQTWDSRQGQRPLGPIWWSAECEQETSFTDNERKEEVVRELQLDIFRGSKSFQMIFISISLNSEMINCTIKKMMENP